MSPPRESRLARWSRLKTQARDAEHDVYLAGQPDRAGLVAARDAGVTVVIDLRGAGEDRGMEDEVSVGDRFSLEIKGTKTTDKNTAQWTKLFFKTLCLM